MVFLEPSMHSNLSKKCCFCFQKPAANDQQWIREPGNPLWIRKGGPESQTSTPNFGSPITRRKINQSPANASDSDASNSKYRTPPQTPFQPGFYKPPSSEPDTNAGPNPFPLSPKPNRKITKEKSSESIASSSSTSSISKKLRRKKREAQLGANASDSDNNDEEL